MDEPGVTRQNQELDWRNREQGDEVLLEEREQETGGGGQAARRIREVRGFLRFHN